MRLRYTAAGGREGGRERERGREGEKGRERGGGGGEQQY